MNGALAEDNKWNVSQHLALRSAATMEIGNMAPKLPNCMYCN